MEIIVGKTAGFCYGVKRAVNEASEVIKKDSEIYCLGELVHNRNVNENLETAGLKYIDNIRQAKGKTIIRAHGVSKEVYDYAKNNNIDLLDLTCTNVIRVHKIAEKYSNNGYYIFLTGKKDHPENIGTISYCKNYSIIEEDDDIYIALKNLKKANIKKLLLISQTTYDLEKFYIIREKISYNLEKDIHFEIENTICSTTEIRQKETAEMSKNVECMIIVGGKNSSNTKKLYEIALKNCTNVIWVEDDINAKKIGKYNRIGIMAGASTPEESINKIINKIKNVSKA